MRSLLSITSFSISFLESVALSSTSSLLAVLGHTPGMDCSAFTSNVSTALSRTHLSICAMPKAVLGQTPEILSIAKNEDFWSIVSNAK
jgi:hypothetical protein